MTTLRDKPSLSPTDARQGERGMSVLVVLVALVLAAIGWAGIELWGRHIDPDKFQTAAPAPGPSAGSTSKQGTIDNSPQPGQPTQLAPTDRSENLQQGVKNTPAQPSRDGVQN